MKLWDKISGAVMLLVSPADFKRSMDAREKEAELRYKIFDLNEEIYAMRSDMERMVENRRFWKAVVKPLMELT